MIGLINVIIVADPLQLRRNANSCKLHGRVTTSLSDHRLVTTVLDRTLVRHTWILFDCDFHA